MNCTPHGWFLIRPSFDSIKQWEAICLDLGVKSTATAPVAALLEVFDSALFYREGKGWPKSWVCEREYLDQVKFIYDNGKRILLTEVYDHDVHTLAINLPISPNTISKIIFSDYLVSAIMKSQSELLFEMQVRFRATEHQRIDRRPVWKLFIRKIFSVGYNTAYWDARINEEHRLLGEEDADKLSRHAKR